MAVAVVVAGDGQTVVEMMCLGIYPDWNPLTATSHLMLRNDDRQRHVGTKKMQEELLPYI